MVEVLPEDEVRIARITALSVAGAVALVAAGPAAGAGKPQRKTVKIFDNYYAPAKLTVNNRSTITWKWPEDAGDSHDVKLESGPKGAKKFASDTAATSFSYKQKLSKAGTYRIVCTLHEEMTMTIKVRR